MKFYYISFCSAYGEKYWYCISSEIKVRKIYLYPNYHAVLCYMYSARLDHVFISILFYFLKMIAKDRVQMGPLLNIQT